MNIDLAKINAARRKARRRELSYHEAYRLSQQRRKDDTSDLTDFLILHALLSNSAGNSGQTSTPQDSGLGGSSSHESVHSSSSESSSSSSSSSDSGGGGPSK